MKKKSVILIAILVIATTGLVLIMSTAGTWLVKSDTPKHADAMIFLMGNIPDRVLQAAGLYNKGIVGKLIIAEESMGAFKKLEERGSHLISNTMQVRNAAVSLGIPAASITILPGNARSKQQEAVIVRKYLDKNQGIDALLIVSSADHTRRASLIFRKAFEKIKLPVIVYSSPSRYTDFMANTWWKHKEETQVLFGEYLKLLNFWIFDKREL